MDNDVTEDQFKEMQADLLNISGIYHHAFGTDHGKVVLKHLKDMTALSNLSTNNMMQADVNVNPSEFMFMREGQNQVIRYIETLINYYKENA